MRKTHILSLVLTLLLATLALAPVSAEEVYVKNKPFQGQTLGRGKDLEFQLPALAEALGLESKPANGLWTLGTATVPVHEVDGNIFVHISALKEAGFRVSLNPEMGTVDIREPKETAGSGGGKTNGKEAAGNWGVSDGPTLVFFGASWCPACRASKPAVSQFESGGKFNVVHVNMDAKGSADYRKYSQYFSGNGIPYFAVLDKSGTKVHGFAGQQSYETLVRETKRYK